MEDHVHKVCRFVEVECQFLNVGCNTKVQRMDVQKHNIESTQIHMSLLCGKLNQSQDEIAQLKIGNNQSQKEIEELKIGNNQSQDEIAQLKMINTQSQKKIEQLQLDNKQSKKEIEQLKKANNQSQNEIEQIKRMNSQSQKNFEQLNIANDQSQKGRKEPLLKLEKGKFEALRKIEKPMNLLRFPLPPCEPPTSVHQDLATFLYKGVEKWIVKADINMQLTYQEWYKAISEKMINYSSHEAGNFMFVKVEKEPLHDVIRWILTDRRERFWKMIQNEKWTSATEILFVKGNFNILTVSSFTNRAYNHLNSNTFICHPNGGMKPMQWKESANYFYFNIERSMRNINEAILCVQRK